MIRKAAFYGSKRWGSTRKSTYKNQHYASFPGFLGKKQEFQSLQCSGTQKAEMDLTLAALINANGER